MSYKLVVKEEAQADIAIAYDYYEAQQRGLVGKGQALSVFSECACPLM